MDDPQYQHVRLAIRLSFFVVLTGVLLLALSPRPIDVVPLTNDKDQHFIAFAVLSGLGQLGWRSPGWGLAFALIVLGGGIEILQGTPLIARDMSLLDWLADAMGVVAGRLAAGAFSSA
jgi:hypothetical protein